MKKTYKQLENEMVRYKDLLTVNVFENNEPFIVINNTDILNRYLPEMSDMKKIFKNQVIVRKSVYEKLKTAQMCLQNKYPRFSFLLTYGYRSLEIQTERFLERLSNCSKKYFPNSRDLYEEVHRSIAVPTVAGHPTGGAIDITILDTQMNAVLDFGTKQYNYNTKDYYVFSSYISKKAKNNRMLLRSVMIDVGFAPFDGEWWHFSYGDREWAYYYKKTHAIYEQQSLQMVKKHCI